MKVFIAGATGVLGRRLVNKLTDADHEVVGLARDCDGERTVKQHGGTARRGDVLEKDTLDQAIDTDVDVVIHAATAIPESTKPSEEEWAQNDRVRRQGAKNLVAAAPSELQQFLFPSVVWVARQPDGSEFDESAPRHPDRATQSAADVEDYLQERGSTEGFDVVVTK